jgi:hypothetical protein
LFQGINIQKFAWLAFYNRFSSEKNIQKSPLKTLLTTIQKASTKKHTLTEQIPDHWTTRRLGPERQH